MSEHDVIVIGSGIGGLTPALTSSRHIGYACSYLPEEIVMAAGFVPHRLMPQTRPAEADAHIYPNTCHYVKAVLAAALEGKTPQLEGFIVTNSCDGMRRLYDVCREYVPGVPAFFLDVPRKQDSDAIAFFASELKTLAEALRQKLPNASVTDERLENSIRTCNTVRRQMCKVLTLQREATPRVRGSDVFDLTSDAAELAPTELRDAIDQFLAKIDDKGSPPCGPRIVLSGNMINRPDLLTLIEGSGAHIVALDTCFGVRHYDLLVEEGTGDPMLALATRYLLRSPCPRMHGLEQRFQYVKGLVQSSGAAGVIYSSVKFCDSHLYDLPLLEEDLRKAGIPFLSLENDYEWTGVGQLRTRVEAFLEML